MDIKQQAKELLSQHSKDYDEPSCNIHCSGALAAIEAALRFRDFTELQAFDSQLSAAYSAGRNGERFDMLAAKECIRQIAALTSQRQSDATDVWAIADEVIADAYPDIYGKGIGWWGHARIANHGILRGAIAGAISKSRSLQPTAIPDGMVVDDTARLDAIASEYLHLVPFDMPTGAGDADVGWSVLQSTNAGDVEIYRHYSDDPRGAIDAAIAAAPGSAEGDGNG